MNGHLSVERRGADPAEVQRETALLWAEFVFDDDAKAALRRDGLSLEGVRISGPSPYWVRTAKDNPDVLVITVDPASDVQRQALLALWQVYFMKRVLAARVD
jgi:hypothetical protein